LEYTRRSDPRRERKRKRAVWRRARYRALGHVDRETKGGTRPRSLTSSSRRCRARRWHRVTLAQVGALPRMCARAGVRLRLFIAANWIVRETAKREYLFVFFHRNDRPRTIEEETVLLFISVLPRASLSFSRKASEAFGGRSWPRSNPTSGTSRKRHTRPDAPLRPEVRHDRRHASGVDAEDARHADSGEAGGRGRRGRAVGIARYNRPPRWQPLRTGLSCGGFRGLYGGRGAPAPSAPARPPRRHLRVRGPGPERARRQRPRPIRGDSRIERRSAEHSEPAAAALAATAASTATATTAPTTASTTAPTTAASAAASTAASTAAPTAAPTTASTTAPTTASTTANGPSTWHGWGARPEETSGRRPLATKNRKLPAQTDRLHSQVRSELQRIVRTEHTGYLGAEATLSREQGEAASQEDGQEAERPDRPLQCSHGKSFWSLSFLLPSSSSSSSPYPFFVLILLLLFLLLPLRFVVSSRRRCAYAAVGIRTCYKVGVSPSFLPRWVSSPWRWKRARVTLLAFHSERTCPIYIRYTTCVRKESRDSRTKFCDESFSYSTSYNI